MNGVFNTGVTIYHREYDAKTRRDVWTAAYYPRASWHGASAATLGAQGESAADQAVIRLFTDEAIPLAVGDMAVRGDARQPVASAAEILEQHPDSVKVLLIRDNRRGGKPLRHWRVEGE